MKIPKIPFNQIERALKMVPLVKDILPINSESESSLLKSIKQLEDALHDKKAEICKLRENNQALQKEIKDLEENLENCSYELNILNNASNNSGG